MVKAEQIPKEVKEAFVQASLDGKDINEAFAAAINAWPGMRNTQNEGGDPNWQHHIILPLHPEKDESA